MFFVTLYRLVKLALQNFFRNFWLSIVTITIIVLSLFSVSILMGIGAMSDAVLSVVNEKVDIALYFKPNVSEEVVIVTRERVMQIPEVGNVQLITADEAFEQFKEKHSEDPLVKDAISELDTNPLSSVLLVTAKNINSYDRVLSEINNLNISEFVEDIESQDRRILVSRLKDITRRLSFGVTIMSLFFSAISVLVVFNTIRLGIYAHKEEIGIMKLVGASNWFVRMPFLINGFFYAILSAIVFWVMFMGVLNWFDASMSAFFGEIGFSPKVYFSQNFVILFLQQVLVLTVVNVISAWVAIHRYLRV